MRLMLKPEIYSVNGDKLLIHVQRLVAKSCQNNPMFMLLALRSLPSATSTLRILLYYSGRSCFFRIESTSPVTY